MVKKILVLISVLSIGLLFAGCDTEQEDDVIYVTVYPVQYMVERIAGDIVNVKRVPGSNVHAESINWGPDDIINMKNSDMILYVSAGLDPYIEDAIDDTFKGSNAIMVDLSLGTEYGKVCAEHSHAHDEEEHEEHEEELHDEHTSEPIVCDENLMSYDPHFWLDPVRFLDVSEYVLGKLIELHPNHEEFFQNNFELLKTDLQDLHNSYSDMANDVKKPILTTNILFNYWHLRYQIEIISMSTDPHGGDNVPDDLIEFKEEIIFHNMKYILYEDNAYSRAGDALYDELTKDGYDIFKGSIHGLGNLTKEEAEAGEDYLSIMRDNLATLKISTQ